MTGTLTSRATAVYLYALCRTPAPAPSGAGGHRGGGPVRALPAGPLTAVVQDVPAAEFTEEALRERLADRAELERCARTHHDVVASAAAHADTLPLPLATLYLSEDGLRDAVAADTARFAAALERIAGREEWGVKVYATPAAAPEPPAAASPADSSPPPPAAASGRAYLDRVRGRARAREEHAENVLRRADRVEAALRGTAVAVRRLRTHGPEVTGGGRTQLLNAACLLPRGAHTELAAAVDRLRSAESVRIEVTGPWVPYSFVDPGSGHAG